MTKALIVTVMVATSIAFGVLLDIKPDPGGKHYPFSSPLCTSLMLTFNFTAILEWAIAFGFTFYLLTFWFDLRQARGVRKGEMFSRRRVQMRGAGV